MLANRTGSLHWNLLRCRLPRFQRDRDGERKALRRCQKTFLYRSQERWKPSLQVARRNKRANDIALRQDDPVPLEAAAAPPGVSELESRPTAAHNAHPAPSVYEPGSGYRMASQIRSQSDRRQCARQPGYAGRGNLSTPQPAWRPSRPQPMKSACQEGSNPERPVGC